jgi:hypothetical protein
MAKDKKKNKNASEFSPKRALKQFTKATVFIIQDELNNVTADELITDIFFQSNDKNVQDLLKKYEQQLILSKVNLDSFSQNLHDFFLRTNDYIKENNMYKSFFKLSNIVSIELENKGVKTNIINAYYDLLVQQYAYFKGGTEYVTYGVKDNGSLMFVPEIGRNLTQINYEMSLCKNEKDMFKLFSKYGYNVKDDSDVRNIITNDQMVTNMLYCMSYYINESTEHLIKKPFKNPTELFRSPKCFDSEYYNNNIKDRLCKRQTLLPTEGITAKYKNMQEIQELYMKEVLVEGKIILLFRVKFDDSTYTNGFYNVSNKYFYDTWRGSSHSEFTHIPLQNIVLQSYAMFSCKLEEHEKDWVMLDETKDLDSATLLPLVKFESNETTVKFGERGHRDFNKIDYNTEFRHIESFLRTLPSGASASDEAKETAKNLGIDLPKNKTFVKDFRKKVYVK